MKIDHIIGFRVGDNLITIETSLYRFSKYRADSLGFLGWLVTIKYSPVNLEVHVYDVERLEIEDLENR